jgi:type I restriction enzyme S subunit
MDAEDLPPGWAWATLGEVCNVIGGVTVDKGRNEPNTVEVPYLRVANVQRGRLDLSKMRTIKVRSDRLEHLALRPGDVLLNEGGDRDKVGRGWVWQGEIDPCVFQNHVFRARVVGDAMNPFFLPLYLNEFGRAHFLAGAKQTTNLASIALSAVKSAPILIAPRVMQDRIVAAVKGSFEELDEAEAALERARESVAQLRVSLLQTGFAGRLVPQDPADEPAAALLARLRATPPAPRRKMRLTPRV